MGYDAVKRHARTGRVVTSDPRTRKTEQERRYEKARAQPVPAGWRRLWNAPYMVAAKVKRWSTYLEAHGVPYDVERNLIPEWAAVVLHTSIPFEQRTAALRTVQASPEKQACVVALYRLARDLEPPGLYINLLREAIAS